MSLVNNRIVQSLYLCTTNSREKMQQTIIENILYTLDMPLSVNDILQLVKSEFHLEFDEFECKELIGKLLYDRVITENNKKISLSESTKINILNNVLANDKSEIERINRIKDIIRTFDILKSEVDIEKVVTVFNEYIYESFLEYGRNAIKYFLPFAKEEFNNGNLIKDKLLLLEDESKKRALKLLISSFTEKIDQQDLSFFDSLAVKTEYFYSLGIPEAIYNKTQDIKINGLVLLADTNFIYSVLGLHSHRQNDSCFQILQLISNNKIDCRIVFIKKTLEELQSKKNDFDKTITFETLSFNQIKSLLDSDKLNNFSRDYFEKKIVDPETPHPSEKIKHSQTILNSKKIQIFNYKFEYLDDYTYLSSKFEDYYDYLKIVNEVRISHGVPEKQAKDDKKLEHDIYLREAIKILRKEKNTINDINYLCLTLDEGLINFDRFANGRNAKGKTDIAPNFILPSVFLRKIRPFIPIISDDYRKAFIASITSNTIDTSLPQYSEAVQRSMTYFKKLGIDDYDLIISIIKQELFFKEFIASEEISKQEEFIRSEIDKAYEQMRRKKEKADEDARLSEIIRTNDLEKHKIEIKTLEEKHESKKRDFENEKDLLTSVIEKSKKEKEKEREQYLKRTIILKKEVLDQVTLLIAEMKNRKVPIERLSDRDYRQFKFWTISLFILYFVILLICTLKFGWNVMEPITYFIGGFGLVGSYTYMAITSKEFNPIDFYTSKHNLFIDQRMQEFSFNNEDFNKQIEQKSILENEIQTLIDNFKTDYPESSLND